MPMRRAMLRFVLLLSGGLLLTPDPSLAQTVGTFRWRFEPYCNILTLTVVQQAAGYLLTGVDDQCGGGAPAAGAAGMAVFNPDGSIGMGLTIVTATGAAVHVNATVTLATISGPWRDADGHTGLLRYNPGGTAGPPRPAPQSFAGFVVTAERVAPGAIGAAALAPQSVTADKIAASAFGGTGAAATVARSDHQHDARYYTRPEIDGRAASSMVMAGLVRFDGVLMFRSRGGIVTSSRLGTGVYHLVVPAFDVGCATGRTALAVVSAVTPGVTLMSEVGETNCTSGNATILVLTRNSVGPLDAAFNFMIYDATP